MSTSLLKPHVVTDGSLPPSLPRSSTFVSFAPLCEISGYAHARQQTVVTRSLQIFILLGVFVVGDMEEPGGLDV